MLKNWNVNRFHSKDGAYLHEVSEHGELSEAAVLDLLHLELSEGVGVISKAEGVEGLSGVQGVKALASWATVHTVSLAQAHKQHLDTEDGDDGLSVDEAGVAEVVNATLREDGGTSLPPHSLADGGACTSHAGMEGNTAPETPSDMVLAHP
jgi:hypothetical protein